MDVENSIFFMGGSGYLALGGLFFRAVGRLGVWKDANGGNPMITRDSESGGKRNPIWIFCVLWVEMSVDDG